jgi:hypothetical protein
VVAFFGIAFVVTAVLLFVYSRSLKSHDLALIVALLPVVWLLGMLPLIGYGIDPMSILVPFLIFSIGVSHAVQMTNAWKQDVLAGDDRRGRRRIGVPQAGHSRHGGLLTNALGFMVIMLIDIPIVHELGITACLGVLLMIMTNKMILPIDPVAPAPGSRGSNSARPAGSRTPAVVGCLGAGRTAPGPDPIGVSLVLLAVGTGTRATCSPATSAPACPSCAPKVRYNQDNDRIIATTRSAWTCCRSTSRPSNLTEACLNWEVMNAVERFDLAHAR